METPELPTGARRANAWVTLALLLWLVALVLPWWSATNHTEGHAPFSVSFRLWDHPDPESEGVRGDLVWATAAVAAVPLPLLFIRVAARSIEHEIRSWRRDVLLAGVAMLAALALVAFWPVEVPFMGEASYGAGEGVPEQTIRTVPGPGWWLGLACLLAVAWSLWRARASATDK